MILDPLHGPSLVPDVPPQQTVISQPPGVLALPQRHPELLLALDELLEVCLAYLHPPSIGRTPHRPRRNLQVGGPVRGVRGGGRQALLKGKAKRNEPGPGHVEFILGEQITEPGQADDELDGPAKPSHLPQPLETIRDRARAGE